MPPPAVASTDWVELLEQLPQREGRRSLDTLLRAWSEAADVERVGLYLELAGELQLVASTGSEALPDTPENADGETWGSVRLGTATLLFSPPDRTLPIPGPLDVLVGQGGEIRRLNDELRRQSFQDSYRLVELEALYEVGLAIASTLELDQLSEAILQRAVSLCDARRGALYLLEDDRFVLGGTIGGDARETLHYDDPLVDSLLEATDALAQDVLPGADFPLAVPVEIDGQRRGLLAVADKESRQGVGPFVEADRRTLGLFANQAAIALENARLHQEALEKERLEREMELAAEIQQRLLPKGTPDLPGFELAGWNRPAWQVGGDYYDYMKLGGGRVGLVVADVTGKGIPAALLVSTLHSALRLLVAGTELEASLFGQLNEHIVDSSAPNKFITLILVELDPASGDLRSLNAGHNPGLLVPLEGEVVELTAGGMPLGLLSGSCYESHSLAMGGGDLLCLYSDGITECESPDEEEFGLDRLRDFLCEHRELPLDEILQKIEETTTAFAAGRRQGDDQTVVLLRRTA